MISDTILSSSVATISQFASTVYSYKVKYVVDTFQGNIDWSIAPKLLRMVPNHMLAKRQPLSNLSTDAQTAEQNKCTKNIVVLVHGHNEDEKDGYDGNPTADGPWLFPYKQDVWTYLYDTFNDIGSYQYNINAGCTAFYEYIYPSFRPIFTGKGNLADDLAQQLSIELSPIIAKGTKPNLFMVAHSMGGLVARAAIQKFSPDLHNVFQKLVTWGSPHHGSVLSSLRYVCAGPYKRIPISPLATALNLSLVKSYCAGLQIDAPGSRDLRWDKSRALALSDWYEMQPDEQNTSTYNLESGAWLYNENTKLLNASDVYASSSAQHNLLNKSKYGFLYGVTSKTLSGGTGKGASLTSLMTPVSSDRYLGVPYSGSDGAVPISSMTAQGIAGDVIFVGDVDHEEYFGAPTTPGNFAAAAIPKAQKTSIATLAALDLGNFIYACPPTITTVSPTSGAVGTAVTINGTAFGTTTGSVTFNGTTATVTSWSDTAIQTIVPTGATAGNVVVKVGGVASNGKLFTITSTTTTTTVYSCTESDYEYNGLHKGTCKQYQKASAAENCPLMSTTYPVGPTGLQWNASGCNAGALGVCKHDWSPYGPYDVYIYDPEILTRSGFCSGTWVPK